MGNLIRIVSAVVNQSTLVLYEATGVSHRIPQGDPRVKRILDQAIPDIERQKFSDVDLSEESGYASFEKNSTGSVKFYKISRHELELIMGKELQVGEIPNQKSKLHSTVDEIIKTAVPTSSAAFNTNGVYKQGDIQGYNEKKPADLTDPNTIVAVVDGKHVVPNMELIQKHIKLAGQNGNTIGLEILIHRMAAVASTRSHSVEDLLRFLERSDLPIADDGTIIIYKVLRSVGNNPHGHSFVDCHTGKVYQSVGTRVFMNESLVDLNRNNECSNGLHVARRSYVGSFSGDVCVVAKLNPEDVIAVPTYDANKMRVCGYNILEQLTREEFCLVISNRPITDCPTGAARLARLLAGNHIAITDTTEIRGQKGADLLFTKMDHAVPVTQKDHGEAFALPNAADGYTKVAPVKVSSVVSKSKAKTALVVAADEGSYRDRIAKLISIGIDGKGVAAKIMELKKLAKKGWEALGVDQKTANKILKLLGK